MVVKAKRFRPGARRLVLVDHLLEILSSVGLAASVVHRHAHQPRADDEIGRDGSARRQVEKSPRDLLCHAVLTIVETIGPKRPQGLQLCVDVAHVLRKLQSPLQDFARFGKLARRAHERRGQGRMELEFRPTLDPVGRCQMPKRLLHAVTTFNEQGHAQP